MVTMNSVDKSGAPRAALPAGKETGGRATAQPPTPANVQIPQPEDSPNYLVYKKMEALIERMQDEVTGVPVRTVKSFMSKIPSVFTGSDLVAWLSRRLSLEDGQEALHLAHLLAAHGYLFPVDDHCLTVKNDGTHYRFQTPYFWPSNQWEPENTDYAVYLCKRTMQNKTRLELADYEAESLARLQKMFSRKWEFIFMQAEAQSKVDKKRDKLERKVLDSQERAFWDVHRPMPGCVNTTEVDIKKACRGGGKPPTSAKSSISVGPAMPIVTVTAPGQGDESVPAPGTAQPATDLRVTTTDSRLEAARRQVSLLKQRIERRNIKVSKVAEACINYYEQYVEYDAFLTSPEWPNPWIADTTELWDQDKQSITCSKEVPLRRVRRWAFGLRELLQDPAGREHFTKFLDKEFSGENLKFWESVQELKALPQRQVRIRAMEIWREYLAPDAPCPINIDSSSRSTCKVNVEAGADRWSFDHAQAHVYHLMKSDSYSRYLRSEMYKDFLNGSKKKTSVKGIRSIVSFSGRKETSTS
ncbi:regulator of G-protein signaling 7 [Arctopsyche grandis]|uniref:regulator of G-protein signaling 7 n=1 Tax=Arctopsyche grandis TaxID=121162 RepID=UPI00406D9EC3